MKAKQKSIVVTRTLEQTESFSHSLLQAGFEVIEFPSIELRPTTLEAKDWRIIDQLKGSEFTWLIFTSPNGVRRLYEVLSERGLSKETLPKETRIAAQGLGTARVVSEIFSRECDLVPERQVAEGLLSEFEACELRWQRMLVAGAKESRRVVQDGLKAMGAEIVELSLYETLPRSEPLGLENLSARDPRDLIFTFFSPSAVSGTVKLLSDKFHLLKDATILAVGPVTAASLKERGFFNFTVAKDFSEEGVLAELLKMNGCETP